MADAKPVVEKVLRQNGIAGQFSVVVAVRYPEEETRLVTFVGSTYGGPVVMVTENGSQLFVTDPSRFGEFGSEPADWVKRFFA